MPKLIEQLSTIIFGDHKKIGADAFVSTRNDDSSNSDSNSNSKEINQKGGDGNENNDNFTPDSGIKKTENEIQDLEQQASEKSEFVNSDKIIIKGKDINDSVARLSRGWNVLFGSIGSGNINNGSIASYLIDTNQFIYDEDNYIRKFINNNFKDISSVIICINLINIIEEIGNSFEFDKELQDSVDQMNMPLVKEDIYKLFNDEDGDVVKKIFDKINLETMYEEDLLKIGVDQSLVEKKSNEAKQEINKESSEQTQTSEDKPSEEGQTSQDKPSEDKPSEEGQTSQDKPSEELQTSEDKPSEEGQTSQDKPSEEGQTSEDKPSEEGQTSQDKPSEEGQTSQDKPSEEGQTSQDKPSEEGQTSEEKTEEAPQKSIEDLKREFEEKKKKIKKKRKIKN